MKRLINHVNSKPEHVRHLTAIGCTIVVGAIVLGFWFRSFQNTTYALLNPNEAEQAETRSLADSGDSLFATISSFVSDMKAQIGGLFNDEPDFKIQTKTNEQTPTGPAHPLPVSN